MRCTAALVMILLSYVSLPGAQEALIRGLVVDAATNAPLPGASIAVAGSARGAVSKPDGSFSIGGLEPGLYNLEVRSLGYTNTTVFDIEVSTARAAFVRIELEQTAVQLGEVEVGSANAVARLSESPLSLRTLGTAEIKRSPGANRDISRVIQTLPGAATTVSFRNDIIIRGGAPNENRFYLDGIEVPNINHFATQGASGGPVGLLNVDLIRDVQYYAGAFPASRGNALSSVFNFQQKSGRDDYFTLNGVVGASDLGLTLEGPLSAESSLIVSARRSYLQLLFDVLGLPFLPTYNDMQFKYEYRLDARNRISLIGLGAIDDFALNTEADDTETKRYLLNNLPIQKQWSYTGGARYENFRDDGYYTLVLSRSALNNSFIKYANNDGGNPANLLNDYESEESADKLRFEDFRLLGDYRLSYGFGLERARYYNRTFNRIALPQGPQTRNFETEIRLSLWSVFAQLSRRFMEGRLLLSAGVRADANDYSDAMRNLGKQLSPRFSAAYYLSERVSINAGVGRYYQLPPYTALGYRNGSTGELENRSRGIRYIRADHLVGGLQYDWPERNATFSVESFYKDYAYYPFLLEEQVSLANLGGDFGVVGNDPLASGGKGRAYGLEALARLRSADGLYGIASYTFMRSEFTDANGEYRPSAWDFRHIISATGGMMFGQGWELGFRWSYYSQAPYTPYDVAASMLRANWDVRGRGIFDYARVNSQRTKPFHQLDLRIDKKFFFRSWSLALYLDVQNVYAFATVLQDYLDVERDAQGAPLVDPQDSTRYLPRRIENSSATVLPTLGIIFEF